MEGTCGISSKIRVIAGSFIPYGSWYGPVQKIDFLHDEIERELDAFSREVKVRLFSSDIFVRNLLIY